MKNCICRLIARQISLSSERNFPRHSRVATNEIEQVDFSHVKDDFHGKIIYDNQWERTVDPSKEDKIGKPKPKKSVEDVLKATRNMRAKFFQKHKSDEVGFSLDLSILRLHSFSHS